MSRGWVHVRGLHRVLPDMDFKGRDDREPTSRLATRSLVWDLDCLWPVPNPWTWSWCDCGTPPRSACCSTGWPLDGWRAPAPAQWRDWEGQCFEVAALPSKVEDSSRCRVPGFSGILVGGGWGWCVPGTGLGHPALPCSGTGWCSPGGSTCTSTLWGRSATWTFGAKSEPARTSCEHRYRWNSSYAWWTCRPPTCQNPDPWWSCCTWSAWQLPTWLCLGLRMTQTWTRRQKCGKILNLLPSVRGTIGMKFEQFQSQNFPRVMMTLVATTIFLLTDLPFIPTRLSLTRLLVNMFHLLVPRTRLAILNIRVWHCLIGQKAKKHAKRNHPEEGGVLFIALFLFFWGWQAHGTIASVLRHWSCMTAWIVNNM